MVHHPQLVENGLHQHELDGIRCFGEQPVRIGHDAERVIKALLDCFESDGQLGDDLLCRRDLIAGFVLFQFEIFEAEALSNGNPDDPAPEAGQRAQACP